MKKPQIDESLHPETWRRLMAANGWTCWRIAHGAGLRFERVQRALAKDDENGIDLLVALRIRETLARLLKSNPARRPAKPIR